MAAGADGVAGAIWEIVAKRRRGVTGASGLSFPLPMFSLASDIAARFRIVTTRVLTRVGFGNDSFLLFLAVVISVLTAVAAVAFHKLTLLIRDGLYLHIPPGLLYGRLIWLLVLLPAAGGLAVGVLGRVFRSRAGHGVVDVIESVIRTTGFIKPRVALEQIATSAITLGTGGSTGAEGPIVQIGAAISSGIGSLFRVSRQHMPVIVGCGCAAGISAIFNAPLGGLLFAMEVILFDFSMRTIMPLVVASVIANVATRAAYALLEGHGTHVTAIFQRPADVMMSADSVLGFGQIANFAILGLLCGLVSLLLTRSMVFFEHRFDRLRKLGVWRPALGGALVGVLGVLYVIAFRWVMLKEIKPFDFNNYPMPGFFGDGYGVIGVLLDYRFYGGHEAWRIVMLLAALLVIKIVATCFTLASGGSGGIIAPALFLGATAGGLVGVLLQITIYPQAEPSVYALVGMGAVLAGVVHAPLASILILFEITQDYRVMLAAMLCSIVSIGSARFFQPDSIYMMGLRSRGISPESGSDFSTLRRLTLEHIALEPATLLQVDDPFTRVLELMDRTTVNNFVVVDKKGLYNGMVVSDDLQVVLRQQDAVPLMIVEETMRTNVPLLRNTDDLAHVFETFSRFDVSHLPVGLADSPGKVIGMISRAGLMRRYHRAMSE